MREQVFPPTITAILARKEITAVDVSRLRATVYGDAIVSADEAEWAFALDEGCARVCPEWTEFLVEAVTDFVVRQADPAGYVTPEMADWLVGAISRDGVVKTASELQIVLKVLEESLSCPPSLSAFGLQQVAASVVDGAGPWTGSRTGADGVIDATDVERLRTVLYAFGGGAAVGVTREEAEVLFDLNDRTSEVANDPAWSDLFVKAVANFLMAARGYVVPTREEALRREAWLDQPSGGVIGLFGDAMTGLLTHGLRGIWASFREPELSPQAERTRAFAAEIRAAETLTVDEIRWLADRIGRDGIIHANERALLRFLKDEAADIHPSLQTLLDTAA